MEVLYRPRRAAAAFLLCMQRHSRAAFAERGGRGGYVTVTAFWFSSEENGVENFVVARFLLS